MHQEKKSIKTTSIKCMKQPFIHAWMWPCPLTLEAKWAVLSGLSPSTVAQVSGTLCLLQTSLLPSLRQQDETFIRCLFFYIGRFNTVWFLCAPSTSTSTPPTHSSQLPPPLCAPLHLPTHTIISVGPLDRAFR